MLYSTRCWVNDRLEAASVSFENGIITDISSTKIAGATDLGDHILMPGIIDAHVHINEPGRTAWEGFDTGTKAAAYGGVTTIVDMPLNASPVTTTVKSFSQKLSAAAGKLHVNCGFYGGLVPGNLEDIEPLLKAGVLGIKCFLTHSGIDEFPDVGEAEIDAAMPFIKKYDRPLLAHSEISEENDRSADSKDLISYAAYLESRPKQWENNAVALMIKLCRKHSCKTHIVHVSSSEALTMIEEAKKEGLPLTAETCPHYIYFYAENIPDHNTLFKCAPPIREKENNDMLKQALKTDVLDFISTDHSPAPPDIKAIASGDLTKAWGGIAGLQFLLPASWTALKGTLTAEEFIPLITSRPARFLGLHHRKGRIAVGYDADLVCWDPGECFVVQEKDIQHRHTISPYTGQKLFGAVQKTFVNGEKVFDKHQECGNNAFGELILTDNASF